MIQVLDTQTSKTETSLGTNVENETTKTTSSMFDNMLLNMQTENEEITKTSTTIKSLNISLDNEVDNTKNKTLNLESSLTKSTPSPVVQSIKTLNIEENKNTLDKTEKIIIHNKVNTQIKPKAEVPTIVQNIPIGEVIENPTVTPTHENKDLTLQQQMNTNQKIVEPSVVKDNTVITSTNESKDIQIETISVDIKEEKSLIVKSETPKVEIPKVEMTNSFEKIDKPIVTKIHTDQTTDTSIDETLQTKDTKSSNKLPSSQEFMAKSIIQKPTVTDKLKFNKNNKDTIIENQSIESIKKVSSNLNLNVSKVAVVQENIQNSNTVSKPLDSLESKVEPKIDTKVATQELLKDPKLATLPMNTTNVEHLREKIFDSKTKMQSFLSDVSRKIVENYKPPLTALKISLNPKELGSIEVVLKSTKNSLNISFNSSPVTMDVLTQNQADLRASLTKQFSQEQAMNFSFSSNQQDHQQKSFFEQNLTDETDTSNETIAKTDIVEETIYI